MRKKSGNRSLVPSTTGARVRRRQSELGFVKNFLLKTGTKLPQLCLCVCVCVCVCESVSGEGEGEGGESYYEA